MPKLTTKAIESLSTPGRYASGDGLYIEVTDTGSKRWLFRYQFRGKRTQLGLGAFSKSNSFVEKKDVSDSYRSFRIKKMRS